MLNKENQELCWDVLAAYGINRQLMMVVEECSELQKVICKMFRDGTEHHKENFAEELVDVIVMCEEMCLAYGVDQNELNGRAHNKLIRALKNKEVSK